MGQSTKLATLAVLLFTIAEAACSSTNPGELQDSQHLISTTNGRILGFESLADWTLVQGSIPAPTKSADHTQGASSLQLYARNYVAVRSAKLSSLGADLMDTVSWDIKLPVQQPNPQWYGETQLFVEVPSLGLYNAYVGQVLLTGLPVGKWQTVSVKIPAPVLNTLRGQYADLVVTVTINAPYNATGAYLLDNLRFMAAASPVCVAPVAECIVNRPAGESPQVVFGYRSCLSSSETQIPVGTDNHFLPGTPNRGQPTRFLPGRHRAQFIANLDGSMLIWQIGKNQAVGNRALPECTPECVASLFDPNATPPSSSTSVAPPSPLSRAESINIRDSFKWSETTAVPENRADGIPLLYHAIIYLGNRGDHDLLDAMRIHYDSFPIFGEERDYLSQLGAPHAYDFDGNGQFVFALIPGALYNAIRAAALDPVEPDEMFPAIQLRDIPAQEAQSRCSLVPIAECVVDRGAGRFTAIFGYDNSSGGIATIPSGSENVLSTNASIAVKPEVFASGTQQRVFAADFLASASVSWTLNGQTAMANTGSARCDASALATVGGVRVPVPTHSADIGDFECRPPTPSETSYPTSQLPPAARANTCMSVNYDYLGTYGLKWRGLEPGEATPAPRRPRLGLGCFRTRQRCWPQSGRKIPSPRRTARSRSADATSPWGSSCASA